MVVGIDGVEAHVDRVAVEAFFAGFGIQRAQEFFGARDRGIGAGDAEDVAAIGDLHAQAQFDLAQVRVEGAGQVGQAFGVVGFEGEVALRGFVHAEGKLRSPCGAR